MNPSFQCPKCQGQHFVPVCPVYGYSPGRGKPRHAQVGYLVRCTRHACGRLWELTNSGLAEPSPDCVPGRTVVRAVADPRPADREPDVDDGRPVDGAPVPRARV